MKLSFGLFYVSRRDMMSVVDKQVSTLLLITKYTMYKKSNKLNERIPLSKYYYKLQIYTF
jgi:hypothetical protein